MEKKKKSHVHLLAVPQICWSSVSLLSLQFSLINNEEIIIFWVKLRRVRRYNNYIGRLKKEAITTEVATLVLGLSQPCRRTIDFPPSSEHNLFVISTSFGSSCKSQTYFHTSDYVLLVNDASVVPRNSPHAFSTGRLNLEFLIP